MKLKLPVGMCRFALMMIFGAGCLSLLGVVDPAVSIVVSAVSDTVVRTTEEGKDIAKSPIGLGDLSTKVLDP